ncbi:TetR/AcrR family transcriptional regulator [Gelidibacter japonicus]|uniref:TetR/AcrR family transcriptional regulator n=1 Tax=Gelidibacter japonicus TaxID=1962232 RepID=UPI003A8CBE5E
MNNKYTQIEKKILKAAKNIFLKKGMGGARMQDIANQAGINKSLIHYYFKNKQTLYEIIFNQVFSIVAPKINRIINDDSSIENIIRNFTVSYFSFRQRHPHLSTFVIHELNENPGFFEKLKTHAEFPNIDKFKTQVDKEIQQGILIPLDAEQLFINIISLNIFPFIAEPFIRGLTNCDQRTYTALLNSRKTEVADFIINSIKRK